MDDRADRKCLTFAIVKAPEDHQKIWAAVQNGDKGEPQLETKSLVEIIFYPGLVFVFLQICLNLSDGKKWLNIEGERVS